MSLQCWINETSWMSLDCWETEEMFGGMRVQATLKTCSSFARLLFQAWMDQCKVPGNFWTVLPSLPSRQILLLHHLLDELYHRVAVVKSWISTLLTNFVEFSWINVYPFLFMVRKGHKSQRENRLIRSRRLHHEFLLRSRHVFVDSVHDANPRNCLLSKKKDRSWCQHRNVQYESRPSHPIH